MTDREQLRERIARAYKALVGPHIASDGSPFIRMPTDEEVADAVLAVLPEYEQVGELIGTTVVQTHGMGEPVYIVREATE